jgi:hypothetical protein
MELETITIQKNELKKLIVDTIQNEFLSLKEDIIGEPQIREEYFEKIQKRIKEHEEKRGFNSMKENEFDELFE